MFDREAKPFDDTKLDEDAEHIFAVACECGSAYPSAEAGLYRALCGAPVYEYVEAVGEGIDEMHGDECPACVLVWDRLPHDCPLDD